MKNRDIYNGNDENEKKGKCGIRVEREEEDKGMVKDNVGWERKGKVNVEGKMRQGKQKKVKRKTERKGEEGMG